jgi:hypothetical protein
VVLFELLAGRLPYRIEQSGIFEIARIVREEQPTSLSDAASGIDSEIELIVAKALQKKREQRYQSAFGLAEDIRRHLRGEAIEAKQHSLSYQARVFARKNKVVVRLAASTVALLVVGIVVTSKLYVDVSAERSRAEAAAAQAIAANEFLKNTLQAAVPPGWGDVRTIGDLCNQVAQDIDDAFPNSPTTEADIRFTIGKIYMALDRRMQSEQQLRKAYQLRSESLGKSHELSLEALDELKGYYGIFGPPGKYLQTAQMYLEITRVKYGPDDARTLEAWESVIAALDLAGQDGGAERMARDLCAAAERKWGEKSRQALHAQRLHASQQLGAGHIEAARTTAHDVFMLCSKLEDPEPWDMRATKNVYAATLLATGEIEKAKDLYGHRKAPLSPGVVHQYQGSTSDLDQGIKVLVFFETWCPFSQRYISQVENMSRAYRDLGVDVVGVTMASRSSSDESVRQFIADYDLTFSILKENGRCSNYFDPSGVPFTVLLHQGELAWESAGHGWLTSRLLEGIVNSD